MGHTRLDSDDNDSDRPLEERVHEQSDDEAPSTSSREESSEDEEQAIEQKLAEVPLEVLARLKKNGRGPVGEEARAAAMAAKQLHFSRENKHRPQEMSSKRPVGRFREVIQVPKRYAPSSAKVQLRLGLQFTAKAIGSLMEACMVWQHSST